MSEKKPSGKRKAFPGQRALQITAILPWNIQTTIAIIQGKWQTAILFYMLWFGKFGL
ncbi:hypothetical protein [Agriterribacter sp.]|uniref:hypothetical protein n=1 Tax=Agriterribacter sp. TaxID=2821509 RepID=UPI002CFCF637|nr:hypothetical protein [Agriterribacter sp.]HTN07552.1 hypothetical protein [Agriterribacter sp.]